jgi:hypothetical protein
MKTYRTYRYGELPHRCIYSSVNKRGKETKRESIRKWGLYTSKRKKMRKGSSK